MKRVGVIGLGAMGRPMAQTLATSGFEVSGFDQSEAQRATFSPVVDDLAGLCDAEAVVLSLPGDAAVASVVDALKGILAQGAVIIDTSTIGPDTARTMADQAGHAGLHYIDAPVSGGAAGAAAGTLLMMVGGEQGAIDRAAPVLDALARAVVRCGGPGSGAVVKLVNNMLCAGQLLLAGEGLAMARANGVSADALLEAVNQGSGRSAVTEVNLPRWVLSGTFDSAFSVGLMAKDVGLAASVKGADAVAAEVAARWREAATALGTTADFNRIVERKS